MSGTAPPPPLALVSFARPDPTSASAGGWLEDTSLVEKYKISDDAYDKREKTYRKWKVRGGEAVCVCVFGRCRYLLRCKGARGGGGIEGVVFGFVGDQ